RDRGDVEGVGGGAGEAAVGGRQLVAAAALVDGQVAEAGDAAADGRRRAPPERGAGRVGAERHRDGGGVGGDEVAEPVEHLDGHRRRDALARGGVRRLLAERQVVRGGGRHGERAGGDGGEAAVGGGQRVAAGRLVDRQVAER